VDVVVEIGKGYAKYLPAVAAGTLVAWFVVGGFLWKAWEHRAETAAGAADDPVTAVVANVVVPALVGVFVVLTVASVVNLASAYSSCGRERGAIAWRLRHCDWLPGAHEPRGGSFFDPG
jgi:hypothetical protein